MSALIAELLRELVAEARLAPSVHNIQPTRWRLLADGGLALVNDIRVRAPVADPTGHDVRVSHGAALKGMSLALNAAGLRSRIWRLPKRRSRRPTPCCARWRFARSARPIRCATVSCTACRGAVCLPRRRRTTPRCLGSPQRATMSSFSAIASRSRKLRGGPTGRNFPLVRGDDYRRELLGWMRLSPKHPLYLHDGLNRDALAMNALEAAATRFVQGDLFATLDRLGLAASLLSDRAKTSSAAAIILFCRPHGEDPLITGRHFYRAWLEICRAGLSACPISALADHPDFNDKLRALGKVREGFRLVNVFRVGRASEPQAVRHFRLPVEQLMV